MSQRCRWCGYVSENAHVAEHHACPHQPPTYREQSQTAPTGVTFTPASEPSLREQIAKAHARHDFIERVHGIVDEVPPPAQPAEPRDHYADAMAQGWSGGAPRTYTQAEYEALKAQLDSEREKSGPMHVRALAEIERLRRELGQLNDNCVRLQDRFMREEEAKIAARSEVERLREELLGNICSQCWEKLNADGTLVSGHVQAERDRLKAALDFVETHLTETDTYEPGPEDIARVLERVANELRPRGKDGG